MEKYDEYKDSGVDWIGDVPCNWQRTRIKFGIRRSTAGVWGNDEKGNGDDVICFRIADFDYPHGVLKFDNITLRNIERNQLEGRLLSYGDLLIEKSGGGDTTPVGRVVRVNYKGKATYSNFIHSVTLNEKLDSNFMYYYFYFLYSNKVNLLFFNQTTGLQNLKVSDYLSQSIYIPPINEQQAIANYLDKQCSKIDKAIATQEKRIELLRELKQTIITDAVTRGINPNVKMKDSGVEWIGEIPSHWKVIPFKHCMAINNGRDYKSIQTEEGYPVMGSGGQFACASQFIYDGEVVLLGRKGTIDKPLYFKGRFWTVDTMFYAIPKRDFCCRFMYYLALTFPYDYYATSTALPSMTQSDLGNNPISIPNLMEQQSIANYLDKQCSKIDKVISAQENRIDLFREYKQSLITEVVTGKRKVI